MKKIVLPPLPQNEVALIVHKMFVWAYFIFSVLGAAGYLFSLGYEGWGPREPQNTICAYMFWVGMSCLILMHLVPALIPTFTVREGHNNYWRVADGKAESLTVGRYWNTEGVFSIFPQMELYSSFTDGMGYIHYFRFAVTLKRHAITHEVAVAFCNWYANLPSHRHDHDGMVAYLHDNRDDLPFTVRVPGEEVIVAAQ